MTKLSKHKPKLGQNFLVDDAARHRIVDALGDISNSTVIEIGPGRGAITSVLAARAKRLICVELDASLASDLHFLYRDHSNVEILQADILQTGIADLLQSEHPNEDGEQPGKEAGQRGKVIGNLPYYITSDILLHLFRNSQSVHLAVLMMQREVADRVCATPGTRDYGMLSCTAQLYGDAEPLFTLPPEAFSPPPAVFSTVLRMSFHPRYRDLGLQDPLGFEGFLRTVFQQKRKTLANNLRAAAWEAGSIERALAAAGINGGVRAEALPLPALAAIFQAANPLSEKTPT